MTAAEEGFSATDACDGDLTAQVQRWEEAGTVYYSVTDSAGNTATARRTIFYHDPIAPEIQLLGERQISFPAGAGAYSEPGFTAADNWDGDLTGSVTVSGEVDCYTAGTYTLTYSVTDSYGNTARAERNVTVTAVGQPQHQQPQGKVIYLTFDDGPGPYTQRLLDILEKYDVKATFFVMKNKYIDMLPKVVAAGHSIGVHSITHRYDQIYRSQDSFFADLYGMQQIIYEKTGVLTTLMRFPGGSSNISSKKYCPGLMTKLVKSVTDQGFQYFDWNVNAKDGEGYKTAEQVYANVVEGIGTRRVAVVLMHECYADTVDAVERIILWGMEHGYRFEALTPEGPPCKHSHLNN